LAALRGHPHCKSPRLTIMAQQNKAAGIYVATRMNHPFRDCRNPLRPPQQQRWPGFPRRSHTPYYCPAFCAAFRARVGAIVEPPSFPHRASDRNRPALAPGPARSRRHRRSRISNSRPVPDRKSDRVPVNRSSDERYLPSTLQCRHTRDSASKYTCNPRRGSGTTANIAMMKSAPSSCSAWRFPAAPTTKPIPGATARSTGC